jgi:Na+-driven multidrug efflux pump
MALKTYVATLFQSIEEPRKATLIALGRGFVFVLIGLIVLPKLFPTDGVWGVILFAEVITAVYSGVKLYKYLDNHKRINNKKVA